MSEIFNQNFDEVSQPTLMEQRLAEVPAPDIVAYDNPYIPIGSGEQRMTNPGRTIYHWQIPIDEVEPEQRDKRVVADPMQRIQEICNEHPPLDDAVITQLIERYQTSGDIDAKEKVILHGSRLVMHFAKRFYGRAPRQTVGMEDLFQQGMLGLETAVDKTDLTIKREKGNKFSTYASWHIQEQIKRYANENLGSMRLPADVGSMIAKLPFIEEVMQEELGRETSAAKAAEQEKIKQYKVIKEHTSTVYLSNVQDVDQEAFRDTDEGSNPVIAAQASARKEAVRQALDYRSYRDRRVIQLRFGLGGEHERTLGDIADRFDLSKYHIRKIESRALKDLKAIEYSWGLRDLMELDDTISTSPAAVSTARETYEQQIFARNNNGPFEGQRIRTAREYTQQKRLNVETIQQ